MIFFMTLSLHFFLWWRSYALGLLGVSVVGWDFFPIFINQMLDFNFKY